VAFAVIRSDSFYDNSSAAIRGKVNVLEKWCDGKRSSKKNNF